MDKIIIPNPEKLEEKIEKFKKDGLELLHILSDFDRSFTKCTVNGKKSSTSWAQFRNLEIFDDDYLKRASEMFEHYHPIEISPSIGETEKLDKMKEWWEKHLALLVEKGVSQDMIHKVVERGGIFLREGVKNIFDFLRENNVPLVFISSGLGDLIAGVIEKEDILSDNIHIVSNFFKFDANGKALSFQGDMVINSHNKNEASINNPNLFDIVQNRKNVILVGDAIEDLKMLDGVGYNEAIKIGFLNENKEENLELFKKSFDIIITDDGNMDHILDLLQKMT